MFPTHRLLRIINGAALLLVLIVPLFISPRPTAAQARPLVVFVQDNRLRTAGDWDINGIAKLKSVFADLGAEIEVIGTRDPIPDNARVVVIVQPSRPIPIVFLARLWAHMSRGNHLLLALDPLGQAGIRTEREKDGLPRLFDLDYGIALADTFVTEPWFTLNSIVDPRTSFTRVYPDVVTHPILAPLVTYRLPVYIWGARTMRVEALGPDSKAVPLLYTNTAYGETAKVFEQADPPVPLEINLDADRVGLLNVAAIGENTATGSRIVVLGDSQIVENEYGLTFMRGNLNPLYPGNRILVERLAAWLLDLPEAEWPPLPEGYTWLAIDGDGSEWPATVRTVSDGSDETDQAAYDIRQVRAARNNDYLYLFIETASAPGDPVFVELQVDINGDGEGEQLTYARNGGASIAMEDGAIVLPDARLAVGPGIEVQIPLREIGVQPDVLELCIGASPSGSGSDCLDAPPSITFLNQKSPDDLPVPDGLLVMVKADQGSNVNLRRGAGTRFETVALLDNGQVLDATGRNEEGTWIQVQNAAYRGWIASFLLIPNGDLMTLPVVPTSSG